MGRRNERKAVETKFFVRTRFRHDLEIAPSGVRFRHVRPNLRVAEVEFILTGLRGRDIMAIG